MVRACNATKGKKTGEQGSLGVFHPRSNDAIPSPETSENTVVNPDTLQLRSPALARRTCALLDDVFRNSVVGNIFGEDETSHCGGNGDSPASYICRVYPCTVSV